MKLTKKQVISIISDCAKKYDKNLCGYQLLFVLKDKNKNISTFVADFKRNNFLHLTGVKLSRKISAKDFYRMCLHNKLSEDDFCLADDGTTQLKLEVLPKLMNKDLSARMVADFDGSNPKLFTDKLVGSIKGCVGFVKVGKEQYFPNTILNVDIRTIAKNSCQIIASYRRKSEKEKWQNVYKTKNVDWNMIKLPIGLDFLEKSND